MKAAPAFMLFFFCFFCKIRLCEISFSMPYITHWAMGMTRIRYSEHWSEINCTSCCTPTTVLLWPIVQSYVMRHCELNNFASCHMSLRLMNIFPDVLKSSQNLIFLPDFGVSRLLEYSVQLGRSSPMAPQLSPILGRLPPIQQGHSV